MLCGVAGAGKTTVGQHVAARLDVPFADADAFHTPDALAKMQRAEALTDDDRAPWLSRLADVLSSWHTQRTGGVLACSALTPQYRARLTASAPGVQFVLLTAAPAVLAARLAHRPDHFFPAALLGSQLATLDASGLPTVATDAGTPEDAARAVVRLVYGPRVAESASVAENPPELSGNRTAAPNRAG